MVVGAFVCRLGAARPSEGRCRLGDGSRLVGDGGRVAIRVSRGWNHGAGLGVWHLRAAVLWRESGCSGVADCAGLVVPWEIRRVLFGGWVGWLVGLLVFRRFLLLCSRRLCWPRWG